MKTFSNQYLSPTLSNDLKNHQLLSCAVNLLNGTQLLENNIKIIRILKKPVVTLTSKESKLITNHMSSVLKNIHAAKQQNRASIVSNIIQIMDEDTEKYVYRYDIKRFYESIHPNLIYNKILDDHLISPKNKELIRLFLDAIESHSIRGVGRGTSLSTALAEYYMKEMDKAIRDIEGVYYYARFVDDIIIVSYKKKVNFRSIIQDILPKPMELHESNNKCFEVNLDNTDQKEFSYLGYKFHANKKKCIKVDLSDNKVKKIKFRLTKAFIEYSKNMDINLLIKRIKYITGNRFIELKNGLSFCVGLSASYSKINPENSTALVELDNYYKSLVFSRNSRVQKVLLRKGISLTRSNFIRNVSFTSSFKSKPIYHFKDINEIKECWNNA
ncbi:antiviral reverse transcriptase Drt3a [Shewanella sedimentimangrovi]|uniref:RNA-directed DNA polymerase n=1 Tax=Shewanella sedimentimangrovi TaxID=2814293 RepID=A0ABX7R0X6_9GAMM|nr:antiviral reverse transcriptase Drt3a [Shewanella sedimentimangrovi]QSX36735.1 RNA-directed DNA polymerase [Shewanella sedimentimangrovi]